MEGTLSLFDWPADAAPGTASRHVAQGGPQPVVAEPSRGEPTGSAAGPKPRRGRPGKSAGTATATAPATITVTTSPTASAAATATATVTTASRVVVFDVETTGTDRTTDQIIELCAQLGLAHDAPTRTWRIKPQVAISPGAQAVHGISADDLAGCPSFAEVADEIIAVFAEADVVVGYNLVFDIDMVLAELARIGRPPIEFGGKTIVDPFRLWQQCEPRSLQSAHKRFVGNGFEDAHSAAADVAATGRVLTGMLQAFGLDGQDWGAIANVCDPQRASWVGPSRHLRWEDGVIVLGFGKHAGAPLHVLAAGPDKGFLRWAIDRDFPAHVRELFQAALTKPGEALLTWARQRYGEPAPTAQPPFADRK